MLVWENAFFSCPPAFSPFEIFLSSFIKLVFHIPFFVSFKVRLLRRWWFMFYDLKLAW